MLIELGKVIKPPVIDFKHLEGIVGQSSVIKKLRLFTMSHSDRTPFPTLLFTGSHGLGKTFLAEKVAKVLGRKFISVNCGSIKKKDDFMDSVFPAINGPSTIFLDESHNLSKDITTVLLTLLNPTSDHKNEIEHNGFKFSYDMKNINLIFATTDAHMMFRPLKNRAFALYFSSYSNEDLIDILNLYLKDITLDCNLKEVADACRSRARDAFLLSQNIIRHSIISGSKVITDKDWNDISETFEIYPLGLNKQEVDLLELIKDHGPISCANLALKLYVNEDNIKSEMEIRLRELGLIENTTKGRQVTDEGLKYFAI